MNRNKRNTSITTFLPFKRSQIEAEVTFLLGLSLVQAQKMSRLAALLLALPLAAALCPQGAVQGTSSGDCYLYGAGQSWQKAEQFCAANKGHLSSVTNSFVNAFLISYPKALQAAQSYWLGAELKAGIDKWTWTDGNNFTYANWAAGKPNDCGPGVRDRRLKLGRRLTLRVCESCLGPISVIIALLHNTKKQSRFSPVLFRPSRGR